MMGWMKMMTSATEWSPVSDNDNDVKSQIYKNAWFILSTFQGDEGEGDYTVYECPGLASVKKNIHPQAFSKTIHKVKIEPARSCSSSFTLVLSCSSSDWRDGSEEPTFQRRPNAKEPLNIWSTDYLIIWLWSDWYQSFNTRDRGQNQTIGTLMRPQGICQMTEIHQLETKSFIFHKKVISTENILVVNIINARNISSDFTGIQIHIASNHFATTL